MSQYTTLLADDLDRIISESVLLGQPIGWEYTERILDWHIPILVNFAYNTVPAYKEIMDRNGLNPGDIKSWRDFDEKFPVINPELYFEMINRFKSSAFKPSFSGAAWPFQDNMDVGIQNTHNIRNRKPPIVTQSSSHDLAGVEIALAGALRSHVDERFIWLPVWDRSDPIAQMFERAILYGGFGLHISPELPCIGSVPVAVVLPPNPQGASINLEELVKSNNVGSIVGPADILQKFGKGAAGIALHPYSHYSSYGGLFPVHFDNFTVPLPNLVYPIDQDGRRTDSVGVLVLNKLFGVAERTFNIYSILKRGIESIAKSTEKNGDNALGTLKRQILDSHYLLIEKEFGRRVEDYSDLVEAYRAIVNKWARYALHWTTPTGTIFLKLAIPAVGQIDDSGRILYEERVPETTSVDAGAVYLHRQDDYPITYTKLPFLLNAIAGKKKDSPVSARVYDVTRGEQEDLFRNGREYFYTQPCILGRDLEEVLAWADFKSREVPQIRTSIEDIHSILFVLYDRMKSDGLFKEVFSRKSGIPLNEINGMMDNVERLISVQSLKRIAYAALVDHEADLEFLTESELERGVAAIGQSQPQAPFYMITPGNTNPFDAFLILSHLLLARLGTGPLVYNVRTSESDLSISKLLNDYERVVSERVANAQEKGLVGMLQRVYFNPRNNPEYGVNLMTEAKASIAYGTFSSLSRARFEAAVQTASKTGNFSSDETNYLVMQCQKDERKRNYSPAFVERAFSEGKISDPLSKFMNEFFSRHYLYQETLNAAVIGESVDEPSLDSIADQILRKAYELGGKDCTSIQNVFVHESHYDGFVALLRERAARIRYGDLMDERTQLAWYDPEDLKNAEQNISTAVKIDTAYEIVAPLSVDGVSAGKGIMPSKAVTGVILLRVDAQRYDMAGDNPDSDLTGYLAKQHDLPLIAAIRYGSAKELHGSMENIRSRFEANSHYPRHLYVAIYGSNEEVRQLTPTFRPVADLIKVNSLEFDPYRPHNQRFFLRDVLGLGPVK